MTFPNKVLFIAAQSGNTCSGCSSMWPLHCSTKQQHMFRMQFNVSNVSETWKHVDRSMDGRYPGCCLDNGVEPCINTVRHGKSFSLCVDGAASSIITCTIVSAGLHWTPIHCRTASIPSYFPSALTIWWPIVLLLIEMKFSDLNRGWLRPPTYKCCSGWWKVRWFERGLNNLPILTCFPVQVVFRFWQITRTTT